MGIQITAEGRMIGHIDYLSTEYARQKDQECYDIEAREKERALDDGQQEGNEYKKSIPGTAPVTKGRRVV